MKSAIGFLSCYFKLLYKIKPELRVFVPLVWLFLFLPTSSFAALSADKTDSVANRIVSGIISFTHWPGKSGLPRLCIFTTARHLSYSNDYIRSQPAKAFDITYINDKASLPSAQCDAIYFGSETPQQQSDILEKTRGRPTLSIAENNPGCTLGAVFCLLVKQSPPAFSVNLDSLSRSGVKVSPDVLLLSRKGY
ncbi:YfiR family protein [Tatumella citrea]|uniref:DUF4154 domain-containing protein n=1 Tax=Tatumella citrea TaxID=53336 RepID=A0A1Y0LLS1_TATCI|nr:YfiR family protein [Tatumella citrea]ARU94983.1 hypothetical protein A7K98_15220 [Tatumella citrea]ARU99021.1 hypothetical protein A7K99_15205 [Tatumella citrea]